jgi:transposase
MRYSNGFRQGVLTRVLPPEAQSVSEVSREVGISEQTIMNWIGKARNGSLDVADGEIAPGDRQASEKLKLVI